MSKLPLSAEDQQREDIIRTDLARLRLLSQEAQQRLADAELRFDNLIADPGYGKREANRIFSRFWDATIAATVAAANYDEADDHLCAFIAHLDNKSSPEV